jgi:uncharacterized protein
MKRDLRKLLTAATIGLLVLASGCGCGSVGNDADDSGGDGAPQTKSSQWTTLGTRATPADTGRIVTSNEGGSWTTYDPPAAYPGTVNLPTQFIAAGRCGG